jgi:hypothetical protein
MRGARREARRGRREAGGARCMVRRTVAMLALLLACADSASAQVIDRIMAVVGGRPIILSDVNAAIQFHLVEPPAGTADPLAYTLERLIQRTLVLAEVERFQPPEPDPIEITVRVDDLQRRAGSAEAFDKALSVTGLTREQLRRHIRDDLRIATYLNQRFGSTAAVAERTAAIETWMAELRRRADVTILYRR